MNGRRITTAGVLVLTMGLCGTARAQGIRYVATTGSDSGDCAAPAAPCRTIQFALSTSAANDEIRVAEGRYTSLWRNGTDWAVVDVDRSISIKGGFVTGSWTLSDPVVHPTVLDAGFQYTIVPTAGAFQAGETVTGATSGASATLAAIDGVRVKLAGVTGTFIAGDVVTGASSGATGQLGFAYSVTVTSGAFQTGETVRGGTSGAVGLLADVGVNRFAIRVTSGTFAAGEVITGASSHATATVDEMRLTVSGRLVKIAGAFSVGLNALTLTGGLANGLSGGMFGLQGQNPSGGGIFALDATLNLTRVSLLDNVAATETNRTGYGGGLYAQTSNVTIVESLIEGNRAGIINAGYSRGGGIFAYHGRLVIDRCRILGNQAGHANDPGGYTGDGGGVLSSGATLVVQDSVIKGNRVVNGAGAGLNVGGGGLLFRNEIVENESTLNGSGGGLYMTGIVTSKGNIFRGNIAMQGGAIYAVGTTTRGRFDNDVIVANTATVNGAAIFATGPKTTLRHVTIASNTGPTGISLLSTATLTSTNTIIAGHSVGVDSWSTAGVVTLDHTLWEGNTTDTVGTVTNTNPVAGSAAFATDGYHLTSGSAAVDAGVPVGVGDDVDGEIRYRGRAPDIGADESPFSLVIPGASVSFEQLAAPPRWESMLCLTSVFGCLMQDYYLRFTNGAASGTTVNAYSITDTLASGLSLIREAHSTQLTFGQAGQALTYGSTEPLVPGDWG